MSKPFKLQPLLEIMQNRTDEASRRLGQLIASEQNARSRLQLLEQYHAEYTQKLREAIATGLTPLALRNYLDFISRIEEAIDQQRLAVGQSERNTAAGQEHWREQNQRMKAIDTLAQRHEARERHREGKLDQKQQDEFSARRFGRGDQHDPQ